MVARSGNHFLIRWFLIPALILVTLVLAIGPSTRSVEAASYRTWIAQVPSGNPNSTQSVRIWMNSDTAFGETAGVLYRIGFTYTKVLGTYDTSYAGANWRADIPAQPDGTFVEYELFTRNEFGSDYGFTGFNWSYTVDDGDVQWNELKHDTFDSYYRNPFGAVPAGTPVTLRFGTKPLNVDSVDLLVYVYDPATGLTSGPTAIAMAYLEDYNDGGTTYAIWEESIATGFGPAIVYYHFRVTDGLDVDYYGDDHGGPHDNLNQGGTGAASDNQGAEGFQLTVYDPAFATPQWLQDSNVYQIFPDRFRNGDPTNDYCPSGSSPGDSDCPYFYGDQDILVRTPWNTEIGNPRVAGPYFNEYGTQFYGGDLQGLIDKLDYLQAAGFDVIYTTPIFDGSSNHRYDTDDYLEIDPALGTLADFQDLITELDARGMYLIVDGVFNHTSSDSLYFDRYNRYLSDGACESLASPYRGWFEFLNSDIPCGTGDYTGWFGYDTLAVLQDGSADVRDFIYRDSNSVVETWYDRGIHGWRFDVADEISHDWWRDFRPYAKADKPDGPLVGEVWPDASNFLLGDQLDSVMNYRFRKNVLGFVRQNDFTDNDNNGNNEIISLSPSQFDRALRSVREDYPPPATAAMLNLLDSHDTNRLRYLMEILGENDAETLARQKLAALFQYTYVGAPMVYYGDEVALDSPSLANHVTNGPEDDPYNRAPYPWDDEAGDDDIYGPADSDMLAFYSLLGSLRQDNEVLRSGGFFTVLTGDTSLDADDNSTYAFARLFNSTIAVVAMNPGTASNTAVLELGLDPGTVLEDKLTGTEYTADIDGNITVTLPARTGVLLMDPPTTADLTIIKSVSGTGAPSIWSFAFTGGLGGFNLTNDDPDRTETGLTPGAFDVDETNPAGYATSASCDNGDSANGGNLSVTLAAGDNVECTFTNAICQPGNFDTTTTWFCAPADPGHFVDTVGASAQTACAPGFYQPAAGAVQCILADAGFYAPGPAAIEQTACPTGTTSPQGSDSIDDCVPTTADLTITKATDPAGGTGFPFTLDPGTVTFEHKWGSNGVGQGQFNGPFGIAVDAAGNVYVADAFAYRVQKFDADGNFILMWGKDVKSGAPTGYEVCLAADTCKAGLTGTGDGEFNLPHGIAVDGAGNVYVGDTFNNRIQKFDGNGGYLGQWGGSGSGNGQFNHPNGVVVDDAGNVYVADTGNNRVQKFSAAGSYLDQWGGLGSGNGQFNNPYGVAVADGVVYVADTFNDRIQVFDADGNYFTKWGGNGGGDSQFEHPYGIAVDAAGNVYVADSFINASPNNRIQKFDAGGGYLGQWGSAGSGDGQFDMPTGVAVARGGDVYVVEYEGHRVQRFSQTGAVLDDGQSYTFEDLAPGTYLVSELVPDDWTLDDITCDGGYPYEIGNTVFVTLAAGDAVECSFSNTYTQPPTTGRIDIIKEADPADNTPFDFTENIMGLGFTLTDPDSNTISFEGVTPGSYTVTETGVTGWTLDDIDCDDTNSTENVGTATATINLAAGETVTCTFYNIADAPPTTGTIIIVKDADPADNTPFSFTETILSTGFTLTDPADNTETFNNVSAGSYTVTEDGETGWTLDDIDCDDTNSTENVGTATATINLAAGETVTCTFYNIADAPPPTTADLTIVKSVTGTGAPADWSFTFNGSLGGFNLTDEDPDNAATNQPPGLFVIGETNPAGYTTTVSCDNAVTAADGNLMVTLAAGDDVTCTFTNAICQPGNFDTATSWACAPADPGHFVGTVGASSQTACAPGFYQDAAGATECIQADPGYYAPGPAATEQTACPSGTTSPAGSDSIDDCVSAQRSLTLSKTTDEAGYGSVAYFDWPFADFNGGNPGDVSVPVNGSPLPVAGIDPGVYDITEIVTDGWNLESVTCNGQPMTITSNTVSVDLMTEDMTCVFHNVPEPPPSSSDLFFSANAAGTTGDGLAFGSEDILQWDGTEWSTWFDGSAAGLDPRKAKHNINAIWIPDPDGEEFVFSFTQNRRRVPGIAAPVDGMDLLEWNGSSFSVYFDGSDVGLTNKTQEKIDALHVLDGSVSPIGSGCLAYLLVSTQGPGKVPNHSGGNLKFGGEDVLGFCATSLGTATTGLWHLVVDGSAEGAPRNAIDSLSASDDGQTLYLTTQGAFNVDSASGGHSVVYRFDTGTGLFSGPYFSAPANGLTTKVDGLHVAGELP